LPAPGNDLIASVCRSTTLARPLFGAVVSQGWDTALGKGLDVPVTALPTIIARVPGSVGTACLGETTWLSERTRGGLE